LRTAGARGEVLIWGGGAKGASFCAMIDPDAVLLAGVIDINATKQGGFIPGTGHPILAPSDPAVLAAKTVIVSNGNYWQEIAASLAARGHTPELWTLDEPLPD
jgi:C-methyltransferase C-terminal domain